MNTVRQTGPSPMSRQTSSPLVADTKPTELRTTSGTGRRSAPAGTVTRSAIESLILKNYTGLRLLILRRVGDAQVAADLLSEAICITWEKWQANQIERPDQIAGYIFQVAVNLLRNHRRSIGNDSRRHVDSRQLDEIPDEEVSRDKWMEQEIADKVKQVIRSMNTLRDRDILTRFYLQEEDKQSICRDLELNASQFDKVLHRARGRLRKLLETHGVKPSDVFSYT